MNLVVRLVDRRRTPGLSRQSAGAHGWPPTGSDECCRGSCGFAGGWLVAQPTHRRFDG